MKFEKAEKIYNAWVDSVEYWIKLHQIFQVIPPSIFPYPVEELDESLTIMEKFYADSGDDRTAKNIQITHDILITQFEFKPEDKGTEAYGRSITDEEALLKIKCWLDRLFDEPEWKKVLDLKILKLHGERDFWSEHRRNKIR